MKRGKNVEKSWINLTCVRFAFCLIRQTRWRMKTGRAKAGKQRKDCGKTGKEDEYMKHMEQDYEVFYRRITASFQTHPKRIRFLKNSNRILTGTVYLVYPLFLGVLLWNHDARVWKTALIPAVSFVLLSLIRKKINRPRPYETWQLDPLISKDTKGQSMPSRHIFSCTVIAMAFLSVIPLLGGLFLFWSVLLALVRVLGGVHYPSDVLAGFLAGIAAGILMIL